MRGAECVILAGDPLQLPPTVLSLEAATDLRLDQTLFERLQGCGAYSFDEGSVNTLNPYL